MGQYTVEPQCGETTIRWDGQPFGYSDGAVWVRESITDHNPIEVRSEDSLWFWSGDPHYGRDVFRRVSEESARLPEGVDFSRQDDETWAQLMETPWVAGRRPRGPSHESRSIRFRPDGVVVFNTNWKRPERVMVEVHHYERLPLPIIGLTLIQAYTHVLGEAFAAGTVFNILVPRSFQFMQVTIDVDGLATRSPTGAVTRWKKSFDLVGVDPLAVVFPLSEATPKLSAPTNLLGRVVGPLRMTVETEKFAYEPGDTVRMTYALSSTADTPVIVRTASSPLMDVAAIADGLPLHRAYDIETFSDPAYTRLLPGQSVSLRRSHALAALMAPQEIFVSGVMGPFRDTGGLQQAGVEVCSEMSVANVMAGDESEFATTRSGVDIRAEYGSLDCWVELPTDSTFISIPTLVRTVSADLNGDGKVGYDDVHALQDRIGKKWGEHGYSAVFDLNGDDAIGYDDFYVLSERWR